MTVLTAVRTWGEMIKFSHSVFALPFALMAAFLAGRGLVGGVPTWTHLGLIVLCMVAARSFAMTFNRIADARIDARNPRTAGRPIQAGRMTLRQATGFLIASGLVFVAACGAFEILYQNPWPITLALPVLIVLGAYSYAKRVTSLAHFILGSAISLAPLAAWIAIDPASLGLAAILLTGVVLFWISGFDIIYACQDVEVDRREGLFSIPARVGVARSLVFSRICHLLAMILLVWLGLEAGLRWLFWPAVAATAVLLAVEQAMVKADDLSKVNLAFFTMNGCVSLLLGAGTICDILLAR